MNPRLPGPFERLVADGLVPREELAPLLALLPDEEFIPLPGLASFDSKRWPCARDAGLTSYAARSLRDPVLDDALEQLDRTGDSVEALEALSRREWDQATSGHGTLENFRRHGLYLAHARAANGLFAYHLHRGLPAPSSEPAEIFLREALTAGVLDSAELCAIAYALAELGAASRRCVQLVLRLARACRTVREATGADAVSLVGERGAIPHTTQVEGQRFVREAGPRLLLRLSFSWLPPWTSRVDRHLDGGTDEAHGRLRELALPEVDLPEDRAPAAVARLSRFAATQLHAHTADDPGIEAVFPRVSADLAARVRDGR